MSTFRSLRRKLNAEKVKIAKITTEEKNKIFRTIVEERIEKDPEFAQDVLNALGETIPEHIKKLATESIKNKK